MIDHVLKRDIRRIHLYFYCCAVVFTVIEVGIFYPLSFFLIKPNILLLLISLYCFYFNFHLVRVVLFCVWCGFLKDMMSVFPIGTHMLLFFVVGMVLRTIAKRFLRFNWHFIIPLCIIASFVSCVAQYLLQRIFFSAYVISLGRVCVISLVELLYGLLLFIIFFKPIKRCVIDKLF